MENQLAVIVKDSGLEESKAKYILSKFQHYFELADQWANKSRSIVVTGENQTAEMKIARIGRLELREKRLDIEKARKELKEQSLREGKAIDGIANVLKALIVPIEEYLERQEKFVELREEAKKEALRIELEKKMEDERLAKEKAEAEERERIRIENDKLKADAIKREREISEERAKAESEKRAIEEKARKEREAAEKKQAEERAKQAEILRAEQKEKALLEQKLKDQIECPHCHAKFSLSKASV